MCSLSRKTAMDSTHVVTICSPRLGERFCSAPCTVRLNQAAALRKMLAQMPEKGKNIFLITHKPNIIDALGKGWFDVKEGEASIFKPEDGKYRLVARVQMEDWPKFVAVK